MKKSILMLASLALLSACGKEANEPVVKQTQQEQAGDRITIALNGTIDEDMAKALSFETYEGTNGKTAYSPVFSESEIPAVLYIYNNDVDWLKQRGDVPYQAREVMLTLRKQMVGGRTVTTFECKTTAPRDKSGEFQIPKEGRRRTTGSVYLDPKVVRATLVVGFNQSELGHRDGVWSDTELIQANRPVYTYGATDLDLSQPIPYVAKTGDSHATRPVFIAENIVPTLSQDPSFVSDGYPYVLFSNIKLQMKGVFLKATIENNDQIRSLRPVGVKVEQVGRADLRIEPPTLATKLVNNKTTDVFAPPFVGSQPADNGAKEGSYMVYFKNREPLAPGAKREYVIYMPVANYLLSDREAKNPRGPKFTMFYTSEHPAPGERKEGSVIYLTPLKKEGIVVSKTFNLVK